MLERMHALPPLFQVDENKWYLEKRKQDSECHEGKKGGRGAKDKRHKEKRPNKKETPE